MAENEAEGGAGLPALSSGAAVATINPYIAGIATLSIPRQVGVIVGLAASIALGVWLVLWSQGTDMRPLYASMESLDATAVTGTLESRGIRYRIDPGSGALLVDASRLQEARLALAQAGVPSQRAVGLEMLDRDQGIGTSQFIEAARYRRGLENELARTIASINSVRGARVHLALPERSAFVRDQRKAAASVLLDVQPGRVVEEGQVRAIGNLVASSVPGLELSGVTIVDQHGKLLSDFTRDAEAAAANRQLEHTSRLEEQLVQRVQRILDPIVGNGHYKAEVTADVDFTAVERADEIYNPDLPALRSEQRLDERRMAGDAGSGIPGALSNQPPVDGTAPEVVPGTQAGAAAPPAEPRNVRNQLTRNYELDRSLSYTRHQVGKVRRLTVAVVLDDRERTDAEGKLESVPWDEESLARITVLVRDAVGYDAARGDSVNVVNAAFFNPPADVGVIEEEPFWRQDWFLRALRPVLALIALLVVLLAVVAPVLRSLSSNTRQVRALEEQQQAAEQGRLEAKSVQAREGGEALAMLPGPVREYQRLLSAVQTMVEGDPERVAQVIRRWVRDSD